MRFRFAQIKTLSGNIGKSKYPKNVFMLSWGGEVGASHMKWSQLIMTYMKHWFSMVWALTGALYSCPRLLQCFNSTSRLSPCDQPSSWRPVGGAAPRWWAGCSTVWTQTSSSGGCWWTLRTQRKHQRGRWHINTSAGPNSLNELLFFS